MKEPIVLFYNPQCAKKGFHRLPASILQVASFIEGVYDYEILDGNLFEFEDYSKEVIRRIKNGVKYLAITIMPGPQLLSTISDLRKIKKECPDVTVIVGGYFPLNHPDVCIKDKDIDFTIIGPGEITFRDLIKCLEEKGDLSTILGLGYIENDKIVYTSKREPIHPNNLPRYPYEKIDVEKYLVSTFLGKRTLSHHSSFGCPFFCNFCAVVKLANGKWLAQDASYLIELVEFMKKKWDIDALEFHDNNFFTSEKRVQEFCKLLIEKKIKISWWGEGRPDTFDKYSSLTWQLMKDSGLKMVFLGAESADDNTLKLMNKGGTQNINTIISLVKKMKEYKIIPELSFILGNPPNPNKDIKNTINFIRKIKKINPNTEIIIYRYDPVPVDGDMLDNVLNLGFEFPKTLEEWTNPKWKKIQKRTSAEVQWLNKRQQKYISSFQTVLNAYYPTSTSRHIKKNSFRYWILKLISGIRYHLKYYNHPVELEWLQKRMAYQRPEISGF